MGITRADARMLLEEGTRRPFEGSLLELGRMTVYLTPAEVVQWADLHGYPLHDVDLSPSHQEPAAAAGCLDDRSFFGRLGFEQVDSLDVDDYEAAGILHDLNQPLPESLHGRYDVVYESGTIQHVFDLPQVFRSIHAALKPGGRVIHGMVPSHNHVDLGFYQLSPTLFADFYSSNGWQIETFYLCELIPYWVGGVLHSGPCKLRRYEPGSLDHLSYGRFGNRQVGLFVVATKSPGATGDRTPQQSSWRATWSEDTKSVHEPIVAKDPPLPSGLLRRWKRGREILHRYLPKRLPPVVKVF